eukprot:GFYU01002427.1.p1 GENE.GFYU01002427.1~~GFYU01002427.1.p1  ORF type:complete len:488 (-),score=161.20 GFYU01002427.1:431-1894(-)
MSSAPRTSVTAPPPPTDATVRYFGDRVCNDVAPPCFERLSEKELFRRDGSIDLELLRKHFLKEGRLEKSCAIRLIKEAGALYKKEPNLMQIEGTVTVVGDIHGQFYDLMKLLDVGGSPLDSQFLFLGDYVDRGCFSCEVALFLFAMKITYHKTGFHMIRGNHECRQLTAYFNFKTECKYKYDLDVYDRFMDTFDCLPLGGIVNGKFLCVHGGLSPDVKTLDDIRSIDRFREPPHEGAMCDLLWSDPLDDSLDPLDVDFMSNDARGCSYFYGFCAASEFLDKNNLLAIIRAHEAQAEGYKMYRKRETTEFPTVITLFSAPNYCDVYNNKGAILKYSENLFNIRQFNCSPHPYYLPNFMNVFTWSIPFVAEKLGEFMMAIINMMEDGEDDSDIEDEEDLVGVAPTDEEKAKRREVLRNKVRSVAKWSAMFKTLREENEAIVRLKNLVPGQKIPKGLLSGGSGAIHNAIKTFSDAKKADAINEKRPDAMN